MNEAQMAARNPNPDPSTHGAIPIWNAEDWFFEEALVASCNGFPVPWSWICFAKHWDNKIVGILCHGFKVITKTFLAQQGVRKTEYK